MIDAWLLDLFPGRTLEELDQMDMNRLLRAKTAKSMERVEERRRLFFEQKLEAKDILPREWDMIFEMDALEAARD